MPTHISVSLLYFSIIYDSLKLVFIFFLTALIKPTASKIKKFQSINVIT